MKKKIIGHNLKCSNLNRDRMRERKVPVLTTSEVDSKFIITYFCDALKVFADYCPHRCEYFQK